MSLKLKMLFIIAIFLISCQRERTNQFDIGDENFVSPPPIGLAWVTQGYYDPNTGYLIGVQIEIDCVEEFKRTLSITHVFYQDISERARWDFAIQQGTSAYALDIYSDAPFPVGDYCLKLYFGEMAIGACPFNVIAKTGKLTIEGVSRNEPITNMSGDISLFIHFSYAE